jgi:DMSO/TMAO reductase YedYZ molybdopterin-dependent catalytic subunit
MDAGHRPAPENTLITMQLGLALTLLLGLMFFSGGLFYLYSFNYDFGPYFTITRAIHFYAGLASIPFLFAKYASTGFRFAGYYLRLPRFQERGPPPLAARVVSPLLALDFFVLYFSGLYMLFHYYYSVANIPPFDFRPVQLHLWASILAVPLLAAHLGIHLTETIRTLLAQKQSMSATILQPAVPQAGMTRRAFLTTVFAGAIGLSLGFQNTRLLNAEVEGLFIGRIPREERGGPGDFPVETLFGKEEIDDVSSWRLQIAGDVRREVSLNYQELLQLPAISERIRLSCVSGWTAVAEWSGPRVREVLALAGLEAAKSVNLHSLSDYSFTWHIDPLLGDKALLATHVNGAPISTNHGFPVRLILPGYPGQNMVKQIDRITVSRDKVGFDPDFRLA